MDFAAEALVALFVAAGFLATGFFFAGAFFLGPGCVGIGMVMPPCPACCAKAGVGNAIRAAVATAANK